MGKQTSYNRFQRVSAKVDNIFGVVKIYQPTFDKLLEKLAALYQSSDYSKLTRYQLGYIRAKIDMGLRDISQNHLEWRVTYNGKLTPSKEVPDGEWSKVTEGRHVWKSNPDRVY